MDNIEVPFDRITLKRLLIREGTNFSLNHAQNKEFFKLFFIKKYKKRIIKRTKIRKRIKKKLLI